MRWNWQQPDWPDFRWNPDSLQQAEARFLHGSGLFIGVSAHLDKEPHDCFFVQAMTREAMTTSEIEGEFLERASVQSSIQQQLGFAAEPRRTAPREHGIAQLMVELYRTLPDPLTEQTLARWHALVMDGNEGQENKLHDPSRYRTGSEPMQIVSGPDYAPKVHFEAPPSARVPEQMNAFLDWFARTALSGPEPLPPLTRAGIAHLRFECIHPFADGNGRIGRAIAEKALAQSSGQSVVIGLSSAIHARRKSYYEALEKANKHNEITDWLAWFAAIGLEAQARTTAQAEFLIQKTRLLDRIGADLNPRQHRALLRMLDKGPSGFEGGMSAGKYTAITGAPSATTTRDLADLVERGVLTRSGERKHTRYTLNLPVRALE